MVINNAPWCSGSTSHFDCDGMGSNPVGAVWERWFESSYPSFIKSTDFNEEKKNVYLSNV